MNTELLLEVKGKILANPDAFNMSSWGNPEPSLSCGTTGCIAGWAVILNQPTLPKTKKAWVTWWGKHEDDIEGEGAEALELDDYDTLFYSSYWPEPFHSQYTAIERTGLLSSPDKEAVHNARVKLAQIAAARIDHLIETGE